MSPRRHFMLTLACVALWLLCAGEVVGMIVRAQRGDAWWAILSSLLALTFGRWALDLTRQALRDST